MSNFLLLAQQAPPDNGAAAGAGAFLGGALALVILFWVVAIATTVFWLWILIDALTREPQTEQKILWFLVIFFLHFVGALIYFFVRRPQRAGTRAAVT